MTRRSMPLLPKGNLMIAYQRLGFALLAVGLISGTALAEDNNGTRKPMPPPAPGMSPYEPAPIEANVPSPDKTPGRADDAPASGSSSEYIHGPNEGPVPGAPAYSGGVPPGSQPNPTTSSPNNR
jgi:hypothetical protein